MHAMTTPARLALAAAVLLAAGTPRPAGAQEGGLTQQQALRRAVAGSPLLASALLDARRAALDERAEGDLYPLVLSAGADGSRTTVPGLAAGGVQFQTGHQASVWTGLSKSFSTGTTLTLDLSGSMTHSAARGAEGPGYGVTGRLALVQPLLRGFGTRVGQASLRQARLARLAGERKADRVASELLRDVLAAWWEAWYDAAALAIQRDSRDLAARQLAEVEARIARGTLAPVEALAFRTALAAREEELVAAGDAARRQALELLRLMGAAGESPDGVAVAGGDPDEAPALPGDLQALAEAASPDLRQASVQVDQAREQAKIAGESSRPRLDLSAWVQGQGLGNDAVAPAFEQIGKAQAGGAFVGLAFEMPVTGSRAATQRAAARLGVESAEAAWRAALQQVRTEAASLASRREAADRRLELARTTEARAREQAEAERRRLQAGTAIALSVQQAEDAWRQARLRVARAQVDRVQAGLAVAHLSGLLLDRYRDLAAGD